MTALENFQRMMRRDRPGWVPFDLPVTGPVHDLIVQKSGTREYRKVFGVDFGNVGPAYRQEASAWREGFERIGYKCPADAEVWWSGVAHVKPPAKDIGAAYHFREMLHPLEVVSEVGQLETLPWIDVEDAKWYAHLPKQVAQIHEQGLAAHGGLECTAFEAAWYLRGMDNLYLDLAEGNGIADWLLDYFTKRSAAAGRAFAAAGVDVIGLGDDVGTQRGMMMSVEFWRTHLKGRLKKVIDEIRSASKAKVWIKYHSDGDIRAIIDDLIEIGVDILNPVQPECMPAGEVIGRDKDRLGFWGMIGTQSVMPFGTVEQVREAVEAVAGFARDGAAVICAPTHVLEPDVPWENIEALVKNVRGAVLR